MLKLCCENLRTMITHPGSEASFFFISAVVSGTLRQRRRRGMRCDIQARQMVSSYWETLITCVSSRMRHWKILAMFREDPEGPRRLAPKCSAREAASWPVLRQEWGGVSSSPSPLAVWWRAGYLTFLLFSCFKPQLEIEHDRVVMGIKSKNAWSNLAYDACPISDSSCCWSHGNS